MNALLAVVSSLAKTLREADRGAVVTFGDNVNISQQLTTDHGALGLAFAVSLATSIWSAPAKP